MPRHWVVLLLALTLLLSSPGLAGAVGPCAIYRQWTTGDSLTASDLTSSMTQLGVTNMVWSCLDDYSSSATQMQSTVDPYPAGAESLATTGQGELERLRHVLKQMTGWTQWYTYTDSWARALGTITTDKQILGGTATWNAAGVTFTAIKANVTDTASAAASKLIDLQVGGVSKFSVDKTGVIGGATLAPVGAKYVTQEAHADLTAEHSLGALTTGLLLNTVAASTGTLSAYGGTSCTNQFPRSLSASGAATCASVANADLAGSIAASKLIGTDIATLGTVTTGTWQATIITSAYGGTGNGFAKFTGPATTEKTFTLPNATATILTDNAAVTLAQGGTGLTAAADDTTLVSSGTVWVAKALPNCTAATDAIQYATVSNTFSCVTISAGAATQTASLFFTPGQMTIQTGAPTEAALNGYAHWLLDPATNEGFNMSFPVPQDWDSGGFTIALYSAADGGNAGNWLLTVDLVETADGGDMAAATSRLSTSLTVAATGAGFLIVSTTAASTAPAGVGRIMGLKVVRNAAGAGDTYPNDVRLVAVEVRYTRKN